MEAFSQHQGTLNYSSPDREGKFYRANLFLKESGEAMGLPPESGAKVSRHALKALYQSLSSPVAARLRKALPPGLKQECDLFEAYPPKEEISAGAIRNDIQEASELERVDPETVAKHFFSYLRDWLEKDQHGTSALAQDILKDLAPEKAKLFGGESEKWIQDAL